MKTIITSILFLLAVISPRESFAQSLLSEEQNTYCITFDSIQSAHLFVTGTDPEDLQTSSPYLALYTLQGFARRNVLGLKIPNGQSDMAWNCLGQYFSSSHLKIMAHEDTGWILSTWLVSLMRNFPEESWEKYFSLDERDFLLDFSFHHWLKLNRMMKVQLSLSLWRNHRFDDARLIFDSVLGSSEVDEIHGTYWFAEENSRLWGRDSVESHAITLCALCEIYPKDPRAINLAQWLLVNRNLNPMKSTWVTAEVDYALEYFLEQQVGSKGQPRIFVAQCKRGSLSFPRGKVHPGG